MYKTTLYLDPRDVKSLKTFADRAGHKTMTACIREAIREYLLRRRRGGGAKAAAAKIRGIVPKGTFGDPVAYQRRLRGEWPV